MHEDIEALVYHVVIVSLEQMMKVGGEFKALLKNKAWTAQITSTIFDEAHCIATWGEFRPEYKELGRLRYVLPQWVPYMVTSATLMTETVCKITRLLHF